jgi:hypothetical protein
VRRVPRAERRTLTSFSREVPVERTAELQAQHRGDLVEFERAAQVGKARRAPDARMPGWLSSSPVIAAVAASARSVVVPWRRSGSSGMRRTALVLLWAAIHHRASTAMTKLPAATAGHTQLFSAGYWACPCVSRGACGLPSTVAERFSPRARTAPAPSRRISPMISSPARLTRAV